MNILGGVGFTQVGPLYEGSLLQPCISQWRGTRNAPRDLQTYCWQQRRLEGLASSSSASPVPASPASTFSPHPCRQGPEDAHHPRANHGPSQGRDEKLTQRPQETLGCQERWSKRHGGATSQSVPLSSRASVCSSAKPPRQPCRLLPTRQTRGLSGKSCGPLGGGSPKTYYSKGRGSVAAHRDAVRRIVI